MSFNRTLWQLTARQIGREARAMMNAGNGCECCHRCCQRRVVGEAGAGGGRCLTLVVIADSSFWAPVINLAREPR